MRTDGRERDWLAAGIAHVTAVDADLARIHRELGAPPLWERAPGYATLVLTILEQQVSLASAAAAFAKLEALIGPVTPRGLLTLDDAELKRVGFSRQKADYCRGLARALLAGELELERLPALDDAAARAALIAVRGIGPWTAEIYLLRALLRPDAWPAGDLALALTVQRIRGLAERPGPDELARIAAPWRPWRAVAARLLWLEYLARRGAESGRRPVVSDF